jgi:NAD(P) transhydrogenase
VSSIAVDHEHILDSDSILSLPYIPRSMVVLGSGVIACEYASIFAALGCAVTLLDKAAEPLGFLDAPLRKGFISAFQAMGGEYRGGAEVAGARFDGFSQVEVHLGGGEVLKADIVFAAFGRVANLEGIGLDVLQLAISGRGHVQVDERFETNIPGIFAAGDAIGPPSLACAAADQGRRAALAAFGLPPPGAGNLVPSGVYTIPEIACVGLSQSEAAAKKIDLVVGRADFSEVARAHIAGEPVGFLALLCERSTARVLGVQTELERVPLAVLFINGLRSSRAIAAQTRVAGIERDARRRTRIGPACLSQASHRGCAVRPCPQKRAFEISRAGFGCA